MYMNNEPTGFSYDMAKVSSPILEEQGLVYTLEDVEGVVYNSSRNSHIHVTLKSLIYCSLVKETMLSYE